MYWSLVNRVFSTIFFYFAWTLCLYEASISHTYYSLLLIIGFISYYFYFSSNRKADLLLVMIVLTLGPLSDILYVQLGVLNYHSQLQDSFFFPPWWVFSLWALFAVNIHLFAWLVNRWFLAVLFGAIGGPLSYLSAIRIGSASILMPLPIVLLLIAFLWALFFPALIWINSDLKKKS